MGNFVHHLSGGAIAGAACGALAHLEYGLDPIDSLAAGVLCCVGSLLPDVDSGVSRPNELLFGITSVLLPILVLESIGMEHLRPSSILLIALGSYLCIRFLLRRLFEGLTHHRGIFHSIPMALIWGALVYLALHDAAAPVKNVLASASAIGYFVHLVIDELFSFVNIEGVRLAPKQSFGTAVKFVSSSSMLVNVLAYAALAYLLYVSLVDADISSLKL